MELSQLISTIIIVDHRSKVSYGGSHEITISSSRNFKLIKIERKRMV